MWKQKNNNRTNQNWKFIFISFLKKASVFIIISSLLQSFISFSYATTAISEILPNSDYNKPAEK